MSRSRHGRKNSRRWHSSGAVCTYHPTPGTSQARRWARIDRREAGLVWRRAFERACRG